MSNTQSPSPEQTGQLLSTLSNQYCRFVLSYFSDASEEHASVDDLATALTRHVSVDKNRVAKQLHHSALPKLEDMGIVEYDARSNTVRYHGHSRLENWLEYISENELENMGGKME